MHLKSRVRFLFYAFVASLILQCGNAQPTTNRLRQFITNAIENQDTFFSSNGILNQDFSFLPFVSPSPSRSSSPSPSRSATPTPSTTASTTPSASPTTSKSSRPSQSNDLSVTQNPTPSGTAPPITTSPSSKASVASPSSSPVSPSSVASSTPTPSPPSSVTSTPSGSASPSASSSYQASFSPALSPSSSVSVTPTDQSQTESPSPSASSSVSVTPTAQSKTESPSPSASSSLQASLSSASTPSPSQSSACLADCRCEDPGALLGSKSFDESELEKYGAGQSSIWSEAIWDLPDSVFRSDPDAGNVAYVSNALQLSVTEESGSYKGAGVRTQSSWYGYGCVSACMKPLPISGVISSLFTYTGQWDGIGGSSPNQNEIDIEFEGYDTTRVQFNYCEFLAPFPSAVY